MAAKSPLTVALDSNVLFDLADKKDFAVTALEVLKEKGAEIYVPPTVFVELQFEIERCLSPEKGKRAERALDGVQSWHLKPILLDPPKLGIAKEFSKSLLYAQLLPSNEFHDGCILAEAALCPVDYLLTSDKHLLLIDREKLHTIFEDRQLPKVEIASPRRFYTLIKRK